MIKHTRQAPCDCYVDDEELFACPLHAAAPRMLQELKHHACGLWCEHERCAVIRAILRDVEGESND